MSTEYDNKVVSMKFDNTNFEKNVAKTLESLEKLKEKLKFKGAADGINNINDSAKKVSLAPMAGAVETVRLKFSAMEVVAITALTNITNQALNTGKSIVKSLTIDPLTTGFKEYETQINAVQTILANTSSKGTTIDQVNAALDELNTYADKTIYNFTEMTRNIGTFTAAGVDLKTSTEAIKGIANLAATSGSTAEQASTAMYQLSQALASGTVKLMDWNSVVNAGMGGEVFQNALKDTARQHGIAIDKMIKSEGSFRETLSKGWLTSDVLTTTLKKFTVSGVNEYLVKNSSLTKEAIENIRKEASSYDEAAAAIAGKSKLNKKEIKELLRMSQVAEDAATKVKTFSQLKDTVKEAVQSGWSQTWRTLVGDFEEAKELFTGISDVLGGIISKSADSRNKLLEGGMTSSWEKLQKKTTEAGIASEGLKATLIETAKAHGVSIDEMIKKEGSFEKTLKNKWMTADIVAEAIKKSTGTKAEDVNKLAESVGKADSEMNILVNTMDKVSGRQLLIGAFGNVLGSIGRSIKAVGKAWENVFPKATGEQLYNLTVKINELSQHLILSKDSGDKLRRTFQGLFSIVKIFTTFTGGALKLALRLIGNLFGVVDLDILGFTAAIGDAATGLNKFLLVNNPVAKAVKKLGPVFAGTGKKIRSMFDEFKQTPFAIKSIQILSEMAGGFKMAMSVGFEKTAESIQTVINHLKSLDKITFEDVKQAMKDVWDTIKRYLIGGSEKAAEAVPGALDIIQDAFIRFQENVKERLNLTGTSLENFADRVKEISQSIKERFGLGDILGAGLGVGMFVGFKKVLNIIDGIKSPMDAVIKVFGDFGGVLQAYQKKVKAEALFTLSKGILVLAAALFIISRIPSDKLIICAIALGVMVNALVALGGVLVGMSVALKKFGVDMKDASASTISLIGFSVALLLMTVALQKIGSMTKDGMIANLAILGVLIAGLVGISYVLKAKEGAMMKGAGTLIGFGIALVIMVHALKKAGELDIAKAGDSLLFIAFAVLAMSKIMKSAGGLNKGAGLSVLLSVVALKVFIKVLEDVGQMDMSGIKRNLGMVIIMLILFRKMMKATAKAGPNAVQAGISILAMSISLGIIAFSMEKIGKMDPAVMQRGVGAISAIFVLFGVVTAMSKSAGKEAVKAGVMIIAMTVALAGVTALMIVLGQLDPGRMAQALVAITIMVALFGAIVFVTRYAGTAKGVQKTLITLTAAIAILAGTVLVLSLIKPDGLLSASLAVALIMATFAGLILASKKIGKDYKSMLVMVGMVVLLTGLVTALSLLQPKNAIQNTLSIGILVATMTAAITVLGFLGSKATTGMLALVGMIAITGLLVILVSEMAKIDSEKAMSSVIALTALLIGMSTAVGILALAGLGGPAALYGVLALGALLVEIGVLAAIVGALVTTFPSLKTFLNEGIPILVQISIGLGEMAGGFVKGFLGQIASALPIIAADISLFMLNLVPFIVISKTIDKKTFSGIKALCEAMLMITGTELLAGFTRMLGFGDKGSLGGIGTEIADFGKGYAKFAKEVAGIDPEGTKKAAEGAKYLAEMIAALPFEGGVMSLIMGKSDGLAAFGKELVAFGPSLATFATSVSEIPKEGVDALIPVAKGATALAEMAGKLPNSGGALGWWVGNNGLKAFGIQLAAFGPNLKTFSADVSEINNDKITEAAKSASALADMAGKLPNNGGALKWWVGDNGMKDFGVQLDSFGKSLVTFSSNAELVSAEDVARGAEAGTALAKMADLIPNSGGTNGLGIQGFGTELEMLGTSLAKYSIDMEDVSTTKMNSVVEPLTAMVGLSRELQKNKGKKNLSALGKEIKYLGKNVSAFYEYFEDIKITRLNSAIESIKALANQAVNASQINQKGITAFNTFVQTLSTNSANAFIKGFEDNKPELSSVVKSFFTVATEAAASKSDSLKKAFTRPVSEIVQGLKGYAEGFTSTGSLLARSFKIGLDNVNIQANMMACVSNTITLIRATSDSFYKAGEYCVDGFANGLMKGKATSNTAGVQLAKATLDGARKKLEVRSPSRAMGKIAGFAIAGYVNRIKDGVKEVYKSGKELGGASLDGVTSTASKIYNFLNGEINVNPVITPVLDLSNVKNGATKINTLMNYNKALSVNTRMAEAKQNGVNIQNGQYQPSSNQATYNFNQYNTSPKAISRTDLYRQTKNQFAMLKGVTVPV